MRRICKKNIYRYKIYRFIVITNIFLVYCYARQLADSQSAILPETAETIDFSVPTGSLRRNDFYLVPRPNAPDAECFPDATSPDDSSFVDESSLHGIVAPTPLPRHASDAYYAYENNRILAETRMASPSVIQSNPSDDKPPSYNSFNKYMK